MADINLTPDYYTKLLINQSGQIINASWLEENDLPDHTHNLNDITGDFNSKIIECLKTFFVNNKDNSVVFRFDNRTKTMSADIRYDNFSITKNEYGEIQSEGGESGSSDISTDCATHTHTTDQIEDFNESVLQIFNTQVNKVDVNDLINLIDNTTIIINNQGKLSAVGANVNQHQHKLEDITDYVVPTRAVNQLLSDLGPSINYEGVIDLSNLSIGQSIVALNYYLKNIVNTRLDLITSQLDRIEIASGKSSTLSILKIKPESIYNYLYDRESSTIKKVYKASDLRFELYGLPYTDCIINLIVDNHIVGTGNSFELISKGQESGPFKVIDYINKGIINDVVLGFDIPSLTEGQHSFRLQYVLNEDRLDYSEKFILDITNRNEDEFEIIDLNPTHIIDSQTYYDKPFKGIYKIKIKNFNLSRYHNLSSGFDTNGELVVKESPINVILSNLFNNTTLTLPISYSVEHSESILYRNMIEGIVINDMAIGSIFSFRIPNSNLYDSIELKNLNDNRVYLLKGDNAISSNIYYKKFYNSGRIFNPDSLILTLSENLDDYEDDLEIKIDLNGPLNLKDISFKCFNL